MKRMTEKAGRAYQFDTVNYHLIKACNAKCQFCFATFKDLPIRCDLSECEGREILRQLLEARVKKINFAGGEPTLVKHLGAYLEFIKKTDPNCITSIITNGKKLTPLLENYGHVLDWVGLSVDSADNSISAQLGRCKPGEKYAEQAVQHADLARKMGVRVKLNSVITRLNHTEEMHAYVRRVAPERWKIFQVLPVRGQNNGKVEALLISAEEFADFVQKHCDLASKDLKVLPEDNNAMQISYVMISPDGRFYDDSDGHRYSASILKVGVVRAFAQVQFSAEKFRSRGGGDYFTNIKRKKVALMGPT